MEYQTKKDVQMKIGLIVTALALSMAPFTAFAACTMPTSIKDPLSSLTAVTPATTEPSSNIGIYSWNPITLAWVLEEENYVLEFDQDQPLPDDVFISPTVFNDGLSTNQLSGGGSTGGGGGGDTYLKKAPKGDPEPLTLCDDPVDMPNVIATAPPQPSGSITTIIFTTIRNVFSPNRGGHGRPVSGGVKQGAKTLGCHSDAIDRELDALRVIGKPFQRGIYLVRFGGGDSQMFTITNPTFSDGGIQQMGKCIDR